MKKGCCYPNLFLTDLSGQEKASWPKVLNVFLIPLTTGGEMPKWSAFQETLSFCLYAKRRIAPKKQKSPCHFWHRDAGRGIKKSTAGKFLWWLLFRGCSVVHFKFITEGSSFFVSTSAIIIITHFLVHVSSRLVSL